MLFFVFFLFFWTFTWTRNYVTIYIFHNNIITTRYRLARETDIAVYYEIYVVYCRCHYENFIVWSDQIFIAKHSLLCDKSWSYTLLMQIWMMTKKECMQAWGVDNFFFNIRVLPIELNFFGVYSLRFFYWILQFLSKIKRCLINKCINLIDFNWIS